MENNTFKSVAFGGFAKQDVITYIEQAAREAAELQEKLQQENVTLQAETEALSGQLDGLRAQVEVLQAEHARMEAELAQERSRRQELEPLEPEAAALREEVARLKPDAEAYAQFRERIGAIECEARKRAADLEEETHARLRQVVAQFRDRYGALMSTFDTTAAHVTGELRKVEVNLTQLPRAMDASGTSLQELAALLDREPGKEA